MATTTQSDHPHRLEDLIPIAVVIAAGCEPCAERMVRRALENGATRRQVEYALGVIAHLRASGCFLEAVGVDLAERMDKPLAAARNAVRAASRPEACACCAPPAEAPSVEPSSV